MRITSLLLRGERERSQFPRGSWRHAAARCNLRRIFIFFARFVVQSFSVSLRDASSAMFRCAKYSAQEKAGQEKKKFFHFRGNYLYLKV